jgi:hypothetical protein
MGLTWFSYETFSAGRLFRRSRSMVACSAVMDWFFVAHDVIARTRARNRIVPVANRITFIREPVLEKIIYILNYAARNVSIFQLQSVRLRILTAWQFI